MRKKSMRFISAALAACMMASTLPVGAFALEVGAAPENGVSTQAEEDSVAINDTTFPDAVFQAYVKSEFDSNGNGTLDADEIAAVKDINIQNAACESLKGVEYFTALEYLTVCNTKVAQLDVSHNLNLYQLTCNENQLTKLDLSQNAALADLECTGNQLTELDLSGNPELNCLWCDQNPLTKLNVSKNAALMDLHCQETLLEELDVSNIAALDTLDCYDTKLTQLDVSHNPNLYALDCNDTLLTKLDVSSNLKLKYLVCSNMQLTALDLSENTKLNSDDSEFDGNRYTIVVDENNTFDLSKLAENGFDIRKVKEDSWTNGTVSGTTLTVDEGAETVTYEYDTGNDSVGCITFTLVCTQAEPLPPDDAADTTGSGAQSGSGAAAAIGAGVLAVGGYYIGTELYRVSQMPGVEALPKHRSELAQLLWERAGKPEPAGTALYADISAEDADAQKAAHWAVEQGLIRPADEGAFKPEGRVTRLGACRAWNTAQQKGLFASAAE